MDKTNGDQVDAYQDIPYRAPLYDKATNQRSRIEAASGPDGAALSVSLIALSTLDYGEPNTTKPAPNGNPPPSCSETSPG